MLLRLSSTRHFLALLGATGLFYAVITLIALNSGPDTLGEVRPDRPRAANLLEHIFLGSLNLSTTESTNDAVDGNGAVSSLPWYKAGGTRYPRPAATGPTGRRLARLWPNEDRRSDRIENQLMFIPPDANQPKEVKKVLVYHGMNTWYEEEGRKAFAKCPVTTCTLTTNRVDAEDADAILFKDHVVHPSIPRPPRQVWILYMLESPYHTSHVQDSDQVNWTATYRSDSDLVAPYDKWVYHDERLTQRPTAVRNFAENKTDKVAWFVSNCNARNNRLQYAQELGKHIQVDIYGACGTHNCPRSTADKCFDLLHKKYKFYLAFENSNCKDYITEKLFKNGLQHDVLPIVMGAPPEDYERLAPKHSYIHVDDFESPEELANYLHRLDKDDRLYNEYFRWKGLGEYINTAFFCRVCALLHDDFPTKNYRDVNDWWRGDGICTDGSWRGKRR